MNDYMEFRWIENHIFSKSMKWQKFAFLKAFQSIEKPIFLISFSEKGDVLSQWRAYANDGAGVSIGFSKAFLERIENTGLKLITYGPPSSSIKEEIDNFLANGKAKDALNILIDNAPLIKNPAFSEEKEWRLLQSSPYSENKVKWRSSRNRLVPYVELELGNSTNINPIDEIILGPKNETPENYIKDFMESIGFSGVTIKKSKASYR